MFKVYKRPVILTFDISAIKVMSRERTSLVHSHARERGFEYETEADIEGASFSAASGRVKGDSTQWPSVHYPLESPVQAPRGSIGLFCMLTLEGARRAASSNGYSILSLVTIPKGTQCLFGQYACHPMIIAERLYVSRDIT